MKKRFVAFLLVLIMVLGMLPVSAMAAGSVVTARGSAENPIRIYENSGNQAETSYGSVQVPVGETVTDSGQLTFSTYSAIEGVQVSTGGFTYCNVTSSNENVVKATGSWSGGVLTINFQGVGNGTAKITVDYTCTCSKGAAANGYLIYNVTVGDGGTTDPSGKPNAPTASDIGAFPDAGKAVLLHCVDAGARGHDATASSLNKVQNGYSVGEVVENPGTYYNVDGGKITKEQFPWMCVVTVHAAPFIELYNSNFSESKGVHKLAGTSNATATLHWFWHNTYGWQYLENPPIQFNITKDTSEKTYTLTYYKNTTDTVTNMPDPNPQTETSNTGKVTFPISNARPVREGYNFLGWAGKQDATEPSVKPGNTVTTTATTTKLYAVWQSNTPPTDKPAKPTENDVTGVVVDIVCVTKNGKHDTVQYPLGIATTPQHTIGEVASDGAGGYICPVTVRTAWFVQQASNLVWKVQHTPTAQTITFNLTYDKNSKTWVKPAANPRIEATHEVTPPTKPIITGRQEYIRVICKNEPNKERNYVPKFGRYTESDPAVQKVNGVWTYTITILRDKHVEEFNKDFPGHEDTDPNAVTTMSWVWKDAEWKLVPVNGLSKVGAIIEVTCKPEAPTADELKKLEMAVLVKCVVDDSQQHTQDYGLLGEYDKDYFVGEPKKVGDDWLCDISYDPDPYVAEFNKAFPTPKHIQNDEKIVPVTLIWVGGSWQIKTQGRVHVTEVYTVTYTDGVENEEVFADQVYSDLRKDSATPAFNGTPTRTGYTFAGWEPEVAATVTQTVTYVAKWTPVKPEAPTADELKKLEMAVQVKCVVDAAQQHTSAYGLLGEYDKDYFVGEPKKVGDDWLCDISYDPDPYVAEFNKAFPTPKHIQNDEKIVPVTLIWVGGSWQIKTQGRVLVTEVYTVTFDSYGGTPVPPKQEVEYGLTATEPAAPEKTGYTFDGWYLGDEKYDFSAAVEQNITLTAKWHVTPHNIYAYARLNSYVAPLTTSEFDTPVTLNEATLSRLGLGSYNSLGYISIGSFTFDAMPLTSDLYFGDDAELSAVAEKLATDIALETGVSDKIAEKIAWTALYKTVNGEDMAPGYPAEAGYQLSGNLNLATVMFKAGGENVTGMPAVNYTYDNILEIHDFYFAGDTFTMPADPTREGYSFEGWSVKVLPDENDADHLDADGADDAADETLLKAGDTYTITKGGVIFTAQWEKKTFTVKYYLPDETGAWVEKKMDTVDSVDYATYSLWTPNAEDGYEFSGWYQKIADIGVKAKVEKLYMAKEWKLYGKFTPIEYNIQYVYNDGKATSTNPTTYTVESDTITLADATGADWGKTFLEWHDENGQKITEIPTGSTGDRVITAYWNWPVHLHYLDKDNNEIESATLYVSELEPSACVLPTGEKTGYDFDGWYEAKKDIGTASHKLNALSIAKKWELYGRYTAKTDVSYTVKYLREGDNKVLAPEKVVTDQTFDTEVTEQAADVVGYTPDAPSKTMILDEYNKVLTFSYSANTYDYTVRHIKQLPDGSYDEANAEVETLSGKFEALAAVTAKDYGEHYPTNDADTKQNIKIEKGLTIDVKYDLDEHTLTFETNGGSAINPVTVRHGNAVARPADPTKDKYTFIGWYVDPEFTAKYDFATVLEADKTIYAKFELTSTPIGDIYVRYDVLHIKQLPDGTYDLANAEVEHLSAKKDTTVTAVIKDYRATHHVNVNRTLSKLTGTAIQPYMGVDGKPVYTILSVYYDLDFHTLTFDTMGGSKIAPETVRHGLTVAKPKDPVNGGYIFDGWYTDKTYRIPYNFATPLTQDTTIYAKWFLIVLPGATVKKNTPKLNTADHFAYVQGYPDGTVKPAGNITRAETAAILFRLMDDTSRNNYYSTKSGFRDVASGSWYNTYVATLNNAGVITDSSNGYFRPNEAITRAELAAMLAKFSETTGAANYFNDVSAKYWAANAIAICAKLGWITGYPDGTFRPDKNVTRAELMAMINRATGRAPKSADAFLPGMKTWIDNTSDKWYYLDVQEATNSHSYTVKGSETWTALTSDPNWSLYE